MCDILSDLYEISESSDNFVKLGSNFKALLSNLAQLFKLMPKKDEITVKCKEGKCGFKGAPDTVRKHMNTFHGLKGKSGPKRDPNSAEIKKERDRLRWK